MTDRKLVMFGLFLILPCICGIFYIHAISRLECEKLTIMQELQQKDTEIASLQRMLMDKFKMNTHSLDLFITAYTPSPDETDNDPMVTSNGETPISGKTCAVSRDLYPTVVGKHIWIEGIGIRKVNDMMNARFTGHVDIVAFSKSRALAFGKQKRRVIILDS